jgi:hypothetical protein
MALLPHFPEAQKDPFTPPTTREARSDHTTKPVHLATSHPSALQPSLQVHKTF